MSDDLERRLREAFEAKASQVTPEMLDVEREHQLGEALAASRRRRRRSVFAGLGGVAAAAAAIAVAVVVTDTPATPRPVIAVTQHTTQSSPASHSSAPLPSHSKTREAEPPAPSHAPTTPPAPPVSTTSSAPPPPPTTSTTSSASTPVESPTEEQTPSTPQTASSAPTIVTSSPTVESAESGNYPLTGTLRQAAGVDFLPLPADPPTTVVDQTGRTTRLSTSDCAAIRSYWETAMPENGWKRAPRAGKDMWFAPTGDAWAFTDAASGACTIQISAGP